LYLKKLYIYNFFIDFLFTEIFLQSFRRITFYYLDSCA